MTAQPSLYLGIDGGGSKTVAVVVDAAGNERGRAVTGGANYSAIGLAQALDRIRAAVEEAARRAGAAVPLSAAWIGLAGVDRPADLAALHPLLQSLACTVRLTNDAELALAALDGGVGVAAIAGTGSIAFGRDAHGATARAGGWGHILGDEGSGYDIGRRALQAAARAADGRGATTSLLPAILDHWRLDRPSDLIGKVYAAPEKAEIARLSALVFAAARTGDGTAQAIVREAAGEIALAVQAVSEALDFGERPLPLALAGGLMIHAADFRAMVARRIRRRRQVGAVAVVEDPALSAARAAARLAHAVE